MIEHVFGAGHTQDKLHRLRGYLSAYSTALKNQKFLLGYIDAFAGSGDRTVRVAAAPLFGTAEAEESAVTLPGSARMALAVEPPLHLMVFIEKTKSRYEALEDIRAQNPNRQIICHHGDANEAVQKLCREIPWRRAPAPLRGIRAVMFLDPYGMQATWETVTAVAQTEAIDLWYLWSLSGLYRQAARRPSKIDAKKRASVTRMLGTSDWEVDWYQPRGQASLISGILGDK